MAAARQPISEATRAQVLELHAAGKGRNEIARELDLGGASVTEIVQAAGLSFDPTATETATRVRKANTRARRSEIAELLLEDAHKLREQLWQPHEYIEHGGRDFDEARWTQPEPSPVDKLKLMQAASSALGRHMDLERHDAEEAGAAARSMLGALGRALGVKTPEDE